MTDMFRLDGKVAVVTGGGRGIGVMMARGLLQAGATVYLSSRKKAELDAAVAELSVHGPVQAIPADLGTIDGVQALVADLAERTDAVHALYNNAGAAWGAPLGEFPESGFDKVFNVNVKGLLFTLQAVARVMIEKGTGGKIINLASQAGRRGDPLVTVYGASKAAVISITQSAGLALISHRINVNGIAPGVVDTPMWDRVDSLYAKYQGLPIGEKKKRVGAAVPYGRMGVPEDHVGAAVFLASPDSDYVVAQTLGVDGGNWMA